LLSDIQAPPDVELCASSLVFKVFFFDLLDKFELLVRRGPPRPVARSQNSLAWAAMWSFLE